MSAMRRLLDWLDRPAPGAREPHPDQLVELVRFPSRQAADLAVWELDTNGIRAIAQHGDANGMAPHYAFVSGHQVLVLARDLERARQVLSR
jgi:hypothetical protein